MKYRLRLGRPLDKTITGVLSSQITEASQSLKHESDRSIAIHSARRNFKQIDALLWLSEPLSTRRTLAKKRKKLKTLSRHLAQKRDADVLVAVAEQLASTYQTAANERLFLELKALVQAHQESLHQKSGAHETKFVLKTLKALGPGFAALKLRTANLDAIFKAAASTYKLGRKTMVQACETRDEEDYHEWRRYVQRHSRQMAFLKSLCPDEINARITVANELGEVLGVHHDLTVLRAHVRQKADHFSKPEDVAKLEALISKSQAKKARQAIPLGKILFTERAKAFRKRLGLYCQTVED